MRASLFQYYLNIGYIYNVVLLPFNLNKIYKIDKIPANHPKLVCINTSSISLNESSSDGDSKMYFHKQQILCKII